MKTCKRHTMRRFLAFAAIGGCLAATCACAAQNPPPTPAMRERFVQMDTNKDGKVVLEEFTTAFPNMNENAFVVIDKNGDKGIDEAEWIEFSRSHGSRPQDRGAPMNNIPGDPLIPPPDSNDLPLMRPPGN